MKEPYTIFLSRYLHSVSKSLFNILSNKLNILSVKITLSWAGKIDGTKLRKLPVPTCLCNQWRLLQKAV